MAAGVAICLSSLITFSVLSYAFYTYEQFYPSVVYLVSSPYCILAFYIQAFVIAYVLFQILSWLFFGQLRSSEILTLRDETWYAVVSTCMMAAMFRADLSHKFAFQFAFLLFIKSFHWLAMERVNSMEHSPALGLKFHLRMTSLLLVLLAVDVKHLTNCYYAVVLKTGGAEVVLGFEYCILSLLWFHVFLSYAIHSIDFWLANAWENKSICLLYVELIINLFTCLVYVCLLGLLITVHIIPFQLIYPFITSLKALAGVISRLVAYKRTMDAMGRFAVVSEADLASMDATCIVCREDMTAGGARRLPCGHVFHQHCLRGWFQRQQTCPTCRSDVLAPTKNTPPQGQPQQQPMGQQLVFGQVPLQQVHNGHPAAINQPNAGNPGAPPPNFMPMPPMPPLIPPPPPPCPRAVLNALSDEELRAMEGDTREAVINRILKLQDVVAFLDAADIVLGQVLRASGTQPSEVAAEQPVNENRETPANVAGDEPLTPPRQESTETIPPVAAVANQLEGQPLAANNETMSTDSASQEKQPSGVWSLRHSPSRPPSPPTQEIREDSADESTKNEPEAAKECGEEEPTVEGEPPSSI